jgi:hypothetical protein
MSVACSMHGKCEKCIQNLFDGKILAESLGTDGKILLKWITNIEGVRGRQKYSPPKRLCLCTTIHGIIIQTVP